MNDGIDCDESECDELGVDRPLAAREPERDVRFEREREPLRSPESGRVEVRGRARLREGCSTCWTRF